MCLPYSVHPGSTLDYVRMMIYILNFLSHTYQKAQSVINKHHMFKAVTFHNSNSEVSKVAERKANFNTFVSHRSFDQSRALEKMWENT